MFFFLKEAENGTYNLLEIYADSAEPFLKELVNNGLDSYKHELAASAAMNDIRWQIDLDNNMYYKDRDTEYEQLEKYITDRKTFLDSVWIK